MIHLLLGLCWKNDVIGACTVKDFIFLSYSSSQVHQATHECYVTSTLFNELWNLLDLFLSGETDSSRRRQTRLSLGQSISYVTSQNPMQGKLDSRAANNDCLISDSHRKTVTNWWSCPGSFSYYPGQLPPSRHRTCCPGPKTPRLSHVTSNRAMIGYKTLIDT